jgi:Family of unknown function (DUF5335)
LKAGGATADDAREQSHVGSNQHRTGETIVTANIPTEELDTKRIPRDQLEAYFDAFTKHFLLHDSTNAVDVELVAPDWGDQFAAEGAHLYGITYDPKDDAIEFELEGGDHRIQHPLEVWVAEEVDTFIKAIQVVKEDGAREIARVNRLGIRAAR